MPKIQEQVLYEDQLWDLDRVKHIAAASFMDISIRIDRVATAKEALIIALGEREFTKIYK